MSTVQETTYSTPVTETMHQHVSVRHYTGEPIPDAMLKSILNAARRGAPTSSNLQAYTIIVVRDPETRKKLAELGGNQEHIETCDVFLAICADVHRVNIANTMHGTALHKNLENFLVASVDAALVGQAINTAAESFGLAGVMIGGMRNHPQEVAEVLHCPENVYVVFGMCLGWPDEEKRPAQKPRMEEDLIIHYEQYDNSDPGDKLRAYDEELRQHYEAQGRNLNKAAWSGIISERFSKPRRATLRKAIEAMGFRFD